MSLIQQAFDAQAQKSNEFLAKRNVVGLGVGYKNKLGEPTGDASVVVLVQQKKPLAALIDDDLIPQEIDGMPTDVVEIGFVRAHGLPTSRYRPVIQPGVSAAHMRVGAGTLGAVVRHRQTGERLLLSNNHVFANSNDAQTGDAILQPGPLDGGLLPADYVARLLTFKQLAYIEDAPPVVPDTLPEQNPDSGKTSDSATNRLDWLEALIALVNFLARITGSTRRAQAIPLAQMAQSAAPALAQSTGSSPAEVALNPAASLDNLLDAALARPTDPNMFSDEIRDIGRIRGTKAAELGLNVAKSGRTTGYTQGRVTLLNATVNVQYETVNGTRTARFVNQVITTGMSKSGDSGSLIVDPADNHAVGLLFAGSEFATIFTPIDRVLSYFNVEF